MPLLSKDDSMFQKLIRNILLHVGLLFVVGVLAVSFSEVILRILGVSYPIFHDYDYERGRALKAGKSGWYRSEGEAYIEINQDGFRDVEHVQEKPKGTYRVAVLGDSYAEARQVSLENTYWKKLEGMLNSCMPRSVVQFEVLNLGVSGYGNAEELLTLRHKAWRYDPNLILVTFFSGNDLLDNYPPANPNWSEFTPRPYFFFNERNELTLNTSFRDWTPAVLKYRALLWGIHNFRTLELLNKAMRVMETRRLQRDRGRQAFAETDLADFVFAPPKTSVHQEAWEITEAILTLMYKEVLEHGAEFLLVTATSPNQIDIVQRDLVQARLCVKALDYPEQRVKRLGEAVGFPVLNLLYDFQRFADQNQRPLHGFPNTNLGVGHWNEHGHDLAGKLIARKICEELLPH